VLAPFSWNVNAVGAFGARSLSQDNTMDEHFNTPPASSINVEHLLAQYRERIIDLEAHGLPGGDALWDVMDGILAEMKRHQTSRGEGI